MKFYHIDSFTTELFRGNPAGVCVLGAEFLSDEIMKQIAMENNMPETAFVTNDNGKYAIRWFTPLVEADLCGHATLAAAHALFAHENFHGETITFTSRKGEISVTKVGERYVLNFPIDTPKKIEMFDAIDCFDVQPLEIYAGANDYLFVYDNEQTILNITPNLKKMANIALDGIIITSKGDKYDFVSRNFAPKQGIDEDPVTGSAHTLLCPYWQKILNKNTFEAAQISVRFGELSCEIVGERVKISGNAVTYLIGELFL